MIDKSNDRQIGKTNDKTNCRWFYRTIKRSNGISPKRQFNK
ncbi:hypothetical protein [Prevotella intermedia]|nr:hypothetical protein [Prevotella intermedia]